MSLFTSNARTKGNTSSSMELGDKPSISGAGEGYRYYSGIVKEYISSIDLYLERTATINKEDFSLRKIVEAYNKQESLGNHLNSIVSNPWEYGSIPDNSIVVYLADKSYSAKGGLPVLCYPFFPSHFSLPIKPGEHIWLIKEYAYGRDVYYWMCRKTGARYTEDTNYTFLERIEAINEALFPGDTEQKEQRGNLIIPTEVEIEGLAGFQNMIIPNLPHGQSNGNIVANSISFLEEFTSEPVPPVRKKCGDTLIQGSNNNLIHLTTEKFLKKFKEQKKLLDYDLDLMMLI